VKTRIINLQGGTSNEESGILFSDGYLSICGYNCISWWL